MARLIFTGMPCEGVITGRFGQVAGYGFPHRGVDIGGNNGAPIYSRSTRPARSVSFTNDGSFGNAVCLQHDHDGKPLYELNAHMSRRMVNVGDVVQPGQLIGYVGATGRVTGPHDHWQLCDSPAFPVDISRSYDPLLFIGEEEDMAAIDELRVEVEKLKAELIGNGFDAVPWAGYTHLFEAHPAGLWAACQPWIDAGRPVYAEGTEDVRDFRLVGNAAFEYGYQRGFSMALAAQLLRKDLASHLVSGGHQ